MKAIGIALLIICLPTPMVSANEPSLGDRRLFFSAQERKAMEITGKVLGLESTASDGGKESRVGNKVVSASIAAQSSLHLSNKSPDQHSGFLVNGFIEMSGFLTIFVNGRPCEKIILTLEIQQQVRCDQVAGRLLPTIMLERMDDYHLAVKASDGKIVIINRQVK